MKKNLIVLMFLIVFIFLNACDIDSPEVYGEYEENQLFYDGLGILEKDREYFYIDENGKDIFNTKFEEAENFYKGVAIVCKDDNYYLINTKGKKISDYFDDLSLYKEHDIIVYEKEVNDEEKYGLLNLKGKNITKIEYDYLSFYDRDFIVVGKNGLYGTIDTKGNEIIPLMYNEQIYDYTLNRAKIGYDDKYIVIDKNNNVILEHTCTEEYEQLTIISENLFYISSLYDFYIINSQKEKVFPDNYQYKFTASHNVFVMYNHNVTDYPFMILNEKGEMIVEDYFEEIEEKNGFLLCKKDELYYVYDLYGNKLTENGYGYISFGENYIVCEALYKDDPEEPGWSALRVDYYDFKGNLIISDTSAYKLSTLFVYDPILNEHYLLLYYYDIEIGDISYYCLEKIIDNKTIRLDVEATKYIFNGYFLYQEVNYSNPYKSIYTVKDINGNIIKDNIEGRTYEVTSDGYIIFEGMNDTIFNSEWEKIYG